MDLSKMIYNILSTPIDLKAIESPPSRLGDATILFGLGDKLQFSMPTVPGDTLFNTNLDNGH